MIRVNRVISVILAFLSCAVIAQDSQSYQLKVVITGIDSYRGELIFNLYDEESKYLKEPVSSNTISLTESFDGFILISDIKPGEYSMTVAHDENKNRKVDTNFWGKPTEKVGFSMNAVGKFGPPAYQDTLFLMSKDKTIKIDMK